MLRPEATNIENCELWRLLRSWPWEVSTHLSVQCARFNTTCFTSAKTSGYGDWLHKDPPFLRRKEFPNWSHDSWIQNQCFTILESTPFSLLSLGRVQQNDEFKNKANDDTQGYANSFCSVFDTPLSALSLRKPGVKWRDWPQGSFQQSFCLSSQIGWKINMFNTCLTPPNQFSAVQLIQLVWHRSNCSNLLPASGCHKSNSSTTLASSDRTGLEM